jgi:hypothetical protein
MLGFYSIYYTTKKNKLKTDHLLILYFIVISAIFSSNAYHLFNITVTFLVAIIFLNYRKIYKKTKSENTKILASAFFILFVSYLIMTFAKINTNIYVAANILQLVAYVVLLYIIIKIYKHGKKK